MNICNRQGNGVCLGCDGTPPIINGYNFGDICRKKVSIIMNCLESGELFTYRDGKLYQVEMKDEILKEVEYTYFCG